MFAFGGQEMPFPNTALVLVRIGRIPYFKVHPLKATVFQSMEEAENQVLVGATYFSQEEL